MKVRTFPVVLFAVVALVAGFSTAACTDKQDPGSDRVTTGTETDKIEASVRALLEAVQQRDAERIRDLLSDSLRQLAPDEQAEMLVDCVPEGTAVQPIGADIVAFGETATATLNLRATRGTKVAEVEWLWEFERQEDGSWALNHLPECPFK